MKPVAAIIERSPVDLDEAATHIAVAIAGERDAERVAVRHEQLGSAARETSKLRKIEAGMWLAKVRATLPASGPKAKGWSEFLARVKIDDSTAVRYMEAARAPKSYPQDLAQARDVSRTQDDDDGQTGPRIIPAGREASAAPFRQLGEADIIATMGELEQAMARLPLEARKRVEAARRKARGVANLIGGSGDEERGTWCTTREWAEAIGPVDHDPFSNPRSKIASATRCMLEDGGDGFGGVPPGSSPGLYLIGGRNGGQPVSGTADEETRTFFQPPYDIVLDVIAHYVHTRFIALLRFSPDTEWFRRLWPNVCAVAFPLRRMDFDPPPGIEKPKASIPYPHALYYADSRDITPEVRALCQIWIVDHEQRPPLHLVR